MATISQRFLPPIPEGCQIFETTVGLVGIEYRRDDVIEFISGTGHGLEIVAEPNNDDDPNALAVIGVTQGWIFKKRKMIGYIPREIAAQIAESCGIQSLKPRLRNIYIGYNDYCIVEFDLVGPKSMVKEYRSARKAHPSSTPTIRVVSGDKFIIPVDTNAANTLGIECECSGEIDNAIACYESSITDCECTVFPFDRLLEIYRNQKRNLDEIRVTERAIEVIQKQVDNGWGDRSKLREYQSRLAKLKLAATA
jgi:hypothetical protein